MGAKLFAFSIVFLTTCVITTWMNRALKQNGSLKKNLFSKLVLLFIGYIATVFLYLVLK